MDVESVEEKWEKGDRNRGTLGAENLHSSQVPDMDVAHHEEQVSLKLDPEPTEDANSQTQWTRGCGLEPLSEGAGVERDT